MKKLNVIKSAITGLSESKINQKLIDMGFTAVYTNCQYIYINYKTKVVVKNPSIQCKASKEWIKKYAVDTVIVGDYFIQPLIKVSAKGLQPCELDNLVLHGKTWKQFRIDAQSDGTMYDIHKANIGIYRGRWVAHDW